MPRKSIFRYASMRLIWRLYTQRLSQPGRWFLWASLVIISYGTTSLEIQAYVPLSYAFSIWSMALVSAVFFRPRMSLKSEHPVRVCAGEKIKVEVDVEHTGGWGGQGLFILPHRLPPEIDAEENPAFLPSMTQGQKSRVHVGLHCTRRGVYTLQGYRVETDYPLGLLRSYQLFDDTRALIVYPKFQALGRLVLPSGRKHHPGGVALASPLGDSLEYLGNREYREGDNLRNIDWRATARLSKPVVREYIEEYFLRSAVILDTHVSPLKAGRLRRWPSGGQPQASPAHDAFERAVSVCASVSDYMARQDYLVDIFAAGPQLYHLTAGRSLAYLDQILDILACVEANVNEPFDVIEPEILEHLSKITTIICVFLDWNENRRIFAGKLILQGAGLKIIIVRDLPCTLDPDLDRAQFGDIVTVSEKEYNAGLEEI